MKKTQNNGVNLTDLQRRFCQIYAETLNRRQALKLSGYKYTSDFDADRKAATLFDNPKIRAYLAEVADLDHVTLTKILMQIATMPITEIFQWDGRQVLIKQSELWSDAAKVSVRRIRTKIVTDREGNYVGTEVDLELFDRLSAIDKLANKLGLYQPQVTGPATAEAKELQQQETEQTDDRTDIAAAIFEDVTGQSFAAVSETVGGGPIAD